MVQLQARYRKIKLFGCVDYNLIPKEERLSKLDPRSHKLFVTENSDINDYRLWNNKVVLLFLFLIKVYLKLHWK